MRLVVEVNVVSGEYYEETGISK